MTIAAVLACLALGAQDTTVLRPEDKPKEMLYAYLMKEAGKHFEARRKAVAAIRTPEELKARQKHLRSEFIRAIGGFPERTSLKPRVVGTEQAEGYRIEKVIYESRPEHYVTATLYLPDGKGPFPGVLMPMGHWKEGKAAEPAQRGCILLAKNGIAALCYDPIGQGERFQLLDKKGTPVIGRSTGEHTQVGIGALLVGWSTASYRIWDGIRSLDYLASRPEVDGERLGCTGCSGGGTMTSYLMALDERIDAAAPSCYITTLEKLFVDRGPQDAEQNITGQVAFGMNHADYVTMRAPQPTLLLTATRDFFNIDGSWDSYREAKLLYGLLGYGERVNMAEYNTKHGYPRPQRESMARWMSRWLKRVDAPIVEGDFPVRSKEQLYCSKSGQVHHDLGGKSVFDLCVERERRLAETRGGLGKKELLREVRRLAGIGGPVEDARKVKERTVQVDGPRLVKFAVESDSGVVVPAVAYRPEGDIRPEKVFVFNGDGKAAAEERAKRFLAAGHAVLTADFRGTGETRGSDFKNAFLSLHLNRPLLGQRVRDISALVTPFKSSKVHVVGVGSAAPVVLHAAALDEGVDRVTIEAGLVSWASVVHISLSKNQLINVVPGALEVYDLPDLAAVMAPRKLTIRNPVDAAGNPVPQADLERIYARARAAYKKAGVPENLVLKAKE